jgi:hypothetical protein
MIEDCLSADAKSIPLGQAGLTHDRNRRIGALWDGARRTDEHSDNGSKIQDFFELTSRPTRSFMYERRRPRGGLIASQSLLE